MNDQPQAPFDHQTERRLIELTASAPETYRDSSFLPSEAFHHFENRAAWEHMTRDLQGGTPIDLLDYESFLDQSYPVIVAPGLAAKLAAQLADLLTARRALLHAGELAKAAHARDSVRLRELLRQGESALVQAGAEHLNPARAAASEVIDLALDPAKIAATFLPCGIAPLDAALGGGLDAATFTVLMSRPSVGKTAALCQMSDSITEAGRVCAVFSKEMTARQWVFRMACRRARVSFFALRQGKVDDDGRAAVMREAAELAERANLLIDDHTPQSSGDVLAACEAVLTRRGRLDYVLVDHLRLLSDTSDNETHRLGAISWNLKQLAKRTGARVVSAAQLSRLIEGKEDKRPDLRDLRDSGEIEENADNVIALYRQAYYAVNGSKESADKTAEFIVRKLRDGERGAVGYTVFVDSWMSFERRANGK